VFSIIFVGTIALSMSNNIALPFILIFYAIIRICDSQWFVTEYTYLRNFTTPESRSKISFTFELITCLGASIISFIGAMVLEYLSVRYAIILSGLLFLAIMVVILDYMRTRIGLKPTQYTKEDLEFIESKEK